LFGSKKKKIARPRKGKASMKRTGAKHMSGGKKKRFPPSLRLGREGPTKKGGFLKEGDVWGGSRAGPGRGTTAKEEKKKGACVRGARTGRKVRKVFLLFQERCSKERKGKQWAAGKFCIRNPLDVLIEITL